jgi:Photoprotection regulator fluorescence recovery protein
MANLANPNFHRLTAMNALEWSHPEKVVARKAFDLGLRNQLQATIRETKDRAARIQKPSELWDFENWLTDRRLEIDSTFDYRYSVLPVVFARLLRDGWIKESDLLGLEPDKLELIRRVSTL